MSATKTSASLQERLTGLKKKAVQIEVVEVESPPTAVDLLKQFKSATGGNTDTANEYIVDVFPNFLPIICFLMMLANRAATAADYKTHAKASPPTIIMYYVIVLYAYFLVSDCYVRPNPSVHARIWKTESIRYQFLSFLMTLPVPEEIEFILAQFAPSSTERTQNVFFIPSAAGFEHHRFFGKFVPIKLFADIHNTTAAVPGNSTPGSIYAHLFKRAIGYVVTSLSWTLNLADLLGLNKSKNNIKAPATKFFQIFETVFNPVLFRDFHRRQSLARIPLEAPEFDDEHYNIYDAMLSFSTDNASELETVLRSLSSVLQSTVSMKRTLVDVLSSASGNNIFHHGYSVYGLPVSSYNSAVDFTSGLDKDTELDTINLKTYAASIEYLQKTTIPKEDNKVPEIKVEETSSGKDASTTHRVSKGQEYLVLRSSDKLDKNDKYPTEDDLIFYDPTEHNSPRVRVLDIDNSGRTDAWLTTLCGKVIETFEIDGNTIPLPNTNMAIGMENTHFADSALPIVLAVKATSFDHTPTVHGPAPPRNRHVERDDIRFSASHSFVNRTLNWLPLFNPTTRDSVTIQQAFPGFTGRPTNWMSKVQTFLGLQTLAPDVSIGTKDDLVHTNKASIYAWSPYTITTRQDPKPARSSTEYSRIYFLVNLRTLFGTDYNMVDVNGAYHALPSS